MPCTLRRPPEGRRTGEAVEVADGKDSAAGTKVEPDAAPAQAPGGERRVSPDRPEAFPGESLVEPLKRELPDMEAD